MYYRKRICAYCGKEFYATAPGQKYCSYECRERAQREKRREYRRSKERHSSRPLFELRAPRGLLFCRTYAKHPLMGIFFSIGT